MENLSQTQKLQRLIAASHAVIQEAAKPKRNMSGMSVKDSAKMAKDLGNMRAPKPTASKYNPLDRTGPVWDAIFAFEKAEKEGMKSFKGFLAQTRTLAVGLKSAQLLKILKLIGEIGDAQGGADDELEKYLYKWHVKILDIFQTKYPRESQLMWGMGWQGPDV